MKQKISMTKSTNLSINEAYELFIRKARIKNLSENTIATYGIHFKILSGFFKKPIPISEITEEKLDEFIMYLRQERKTSDITIASYMRTIRSFLYYCMDCGYIKRYKIVIPKTTKKIKETYTDTELQRLLKRPDTNSCSFSEFKTWVFENYLLGTGNRLSTALNVRIKDVDFGNATITLCKTKNRKQQIIPLSHTLSSTLTEYLTIRGGEDEDYVFCNIYGAKGSARAYQDLVQDYNLKRGVTKTSIHLFRHTFAKNWILAGGDIFRLQKILGHSSLDVTKEYVNMFGQDLQMDFEKFNPLDTMRQKTTPIRM